MVVMKLVVKEPSEKRKSRQLFPTPTKTLTRTGISNNHERGRKKQDIVCRPAHNVRIESPLKSHRFKLLLKSDTNWQEMRTASRYWCKILGSNLVELKNPEKSFKWFTLKKNPIKNQSLIDIKQVGLLTPK